MVPVFINRKTGAPFRNRSNFFCDRPQPIGTSQSEIIQIQKLPGYRSIKNMSQIRLVFLACSRNRLVIDDTDFFDSIFLTDFVEFRPHYYFMVSFIRKPKRKFDEFCIRILKFQVLQFFFLLVFLKTHSTKTSFLENLMTKYGFRDKVTTICIIFHLIVSLSGFAVRFCDRNF